MSNNPPPTNPPLHSTNPPLHSSAARDSFIEDLPPSRVPSVAHSRVGRTSAAGSTMHSCVPSRNPSIIDHLDGSSLDAGSVNQTDGTRRLEHIFTNVLASSSGPTLADKTFRASQRHPIPSHPLPSIPPCLPSRVPTTAVRNPPAAAPTHQSTAQVPAMSREQADFETAQFALKQAKWISSTVSAITHTIKPEHQLKADGSNFSQWSRHLKEIGCTSLTGPEFFFTPCDNLSFDKIGRAVFLASVHQSLTSDLQEISSVRAMYENIRSKFQTVSRAAQMNLWYKLMSFKIDPTAPTAGVASKLKDLYAKMKAVNVRMHGDALLGFILQSAIMSSPAGFKKDFKQRVELLIQNDAQSTCPTFPQLIHLFGICQQQHQLGAPQQTASVLVPLANNNSIMQISANAPDNFDLIAYLADVDEAEWTNALDFYAVTANKCWSCGGDNHYARDCPQKAQSRSTSKAIGTIVGTIYGRLPSGFQVTSNRFPNMSKRAGHTTPSTSQQHARCLANYYRPRYSQGPNSHPGQSSATPQAQAQGQITAHAVEVNGLPDDLDDLDFNSMAIGEDVLPVEEACLYQDMEI